MYKSKKYLIHVVAKDYYALTHLYGKTFKLLYQLVEASVIIKYTTQLPT